MGFLDKYLNKKVEKPVVEAVSSEEMNNISEEMRQKAYLAQEARRENYEIQRIEREKRKIMRRIELETAKAELLDLQRELNGDDEDEEDTNSSMEMKMLSLAEKFLTPKSNTPQVPVETPQYQQEEALIDDETLKIIQNKLPAQMKEYLKNIDKGSLLKLKSNIEQEA